MTPIERIQEMEGHLNAYQGLIEELEACLQRVEAGQSRYIALRDYYTSQVYMEDVELSNQPDFPEEGLLWSLIGRCRLRFVGRALPKGSGNARPCNQDVKRAIRTQKEAGTKVLASQLSLDYRARRSG